LCRKRGTGISTVYAAGGLWEETLGGSKRAVYTLQGRAVAQRDGATNQVLYLHGDHLGSVAVVTDQAGAVVSRQQYDPWGAPRGGEGIGEERTALDFTGQRRDGTGLLFYNARYYDPVTARFVSADTIVPGRASDGRGTAPERASASPAGAMAQSGASAPGGTVEAAATTPPVARGWDERAALRPLTVSFHEPAFAVALGVEHRFTQEQGFHFQLADKVRERAQGQWGPRDPQALNRYAYVLNNPLKYTDPTGHDCLDATGGGQANCAGGGGGRSVDYDDGAYIDININIGPISLGVALDDGKIYPYIGVTAAADPLGASFTVVEGAPSQGWELGGQACWGVCLTAQAQDGSVQNGFGVGTPGFSGELVYNFDYVDWGLLEDR
jgi:RHS repeat-associated protein